MQILGAETPDAMIREAYRRGDPLKTMTSAHRVDAGSIFDVVADEPRGELERARSVRRRATQALGALWTNVDMVTRLDDSGIALSDTPKVVGALGSDIDVEVAVAMLHFLGIPDEAPELPGPKRLSDKLSLLYVLGKHQGIEPDYQLALAKMPLDAVAAFREFVKPEITYTRLAEILAVAETTALAIRAKTITTITYSEYNEGAEQISRRLGRISSDESDPWPVPVATLVNRYGGGNWHGAVDTIGLKVGTPEGRFGTQEHQDAIDSFLDECEMCGYSMNEETYDFWVFSQAGMLMERPSAVEIIRHFGVSWDELIDQIFGGEATEISATPLQSALLQQARLEELQEPVLAGARTCSRRWLAPDGKSHQRSTGTNALEQLPKSGVREALGAPEPTPMPKQHPARTESGARSFRRNSFPPLIGRSTRNI